MMSTWNTRVQWLIDNTLLAFIGVFFLVTLNFYIMRWLLPSYIPYDVQRIFQLGFLILQGVLVLCSRRLQGDWFFAFNRLSRWVRYALGGILVLGFISSLRAPLVNMALLELAFYFLLVSFIFLLAGLIGRKPQSYQTSLMRIFYLGAITFIAVFISVIVKAVHHSGDDLAIGMPGFINIRYFSEYQIWGLLLMLVPFSVPSRNKVFLLFLGLIFSLWWMMVFLDYSKGMLLSLALAVIVVVLCYGKLGLRWVGKQSIFAVLGLMFYGLIFHSGHTQAITQGAHLHSAVVTETMYQSAVPRLVLWQQAWQLFLSHPWFGVGPMHYAYYPNLYAAHAHNGYLQFLAEWGGLAFILLITILVFAVIAWFRRFNRQSLAGKSVVEQAVIIGLTAALVAGLSYISVGGALVTPLSQIMFCIIVAWALAVYQLEAPVGVVTPILVYQRVGFMILLALAFTFVFIMVAGVIFMLPQLEMEWLMGTQFKGILMPGFWAQGRLC